MTWNGNIGLKSMNINLKEQIQHVLSNCSQYLILIYTAIYDQVTDSSLFWFKNSSKLFHFLLFSHCFYAKKVPSYSETTLFTYIYSSIMTCFILLPLIYYFVFISLIPSFLHTLWPRIVSIVMVELIWLFLE